MSESRCGSLELLLAGGDMSTFQCGSTTSNATQWNNMPSFIFQTQNLRRVHPPDNVVIDNISLSFYAGAKIGVIGGNGAGKSTLLRIMAGIDRDFQGIAQPAEGTRIGFLPQEPELDPTKTVREIVEEGVAETRALLTRFEEISAKFAEPMSDDEMEQLLAEQGKVQDLIDATNAWELDRTVEIAMDALRVPPADLSAEVISGGERRRVALCRLLLQHPDMLLLDEPTNHLDAESVAWLEQFLAEYSGTVIAVTHDRYFLDNVAQWILELDRGRGIPWRGNYSSWLEQKQERLRVEEKQESARQQTLQRELDWIRMAPRARQAKGKARVNAYEDLLIQGGNERQGRAEIIIPVGPRLGDLVIETKDLVKGFGDKLLIDNMELIIPRGAIVGIIGPNGAGKTTLFRMIVGQDSPDGGSVRVGETVRLSYVDQLRDDLEPDKTVWEVISGGDERIELGNGDMNSRAYVSSFNFRGAEQQKRVGSLSGGERNRVHLAKLLRGKGNVILLDEPTNDLDVDTLRALEDALLSFAGCALVISHDRWFLDRVATNILAFEGDSHVRWFEGNWTEYEEARKKRLGSEAEQPHRIRYKPIGGR